MIFNEYVTVQMRIKCKIWNCESANLTMYKVRNEMRKYFTDDTKSTSTTGLPENRRSPQISRI